MKVVQSKKRKKSKLLRVAVFVFSAYVIGTLISQQMQIAEKRSELNDLTAQIEAQRLRNEDLERSLSADGGITPRDVRAGLVRIKTAEKTVEVVEVAEPFPAREKILRLKLSAEGVRGEENV